MENERKNDESNIRDQMKKEAEVIGGHAFKGETRGCAGRERYCEAVHEDVNDGTETKGMLRVSRNIIKAIVTTLITTY